MKTGQWPKRCSWSFLIDVFLINQSSIGDKQNKYHE